MKAIVLLLLMASMAEAAPRRRSVVVRQSATCQNCINPRLQVVQQPFVQRINAVATAAYSPVVAPQGLWQTAPYLQQQAQQTYADRRSPEFLQLQSDNAQMKAWIQGAQWGSSQAQLYQAPTQYNVEPTQQWQEGRPWSPEEVARHQKLLPQNQQQEVGVPGGRPQERSMPEPMPEPAPQQPQQPPDSGVERVIPDNWYPTLKAQCASCHSGSEPKGGFYIDGEVDLRSEQAAGDAWLILKMAYNGHMPKTADGRSRMLEDETFAAILHELLVDSPPEEAQGPAAPPEGWQGSTTQPDTNGNGLERWNRPQPLTDPSGY